MNIFKMLFGAKTATAPANQLLPAAPHEQSSLEGELGHYSGYERQAALERCAALDRTDLLPLVVVRLNDWVPAVRHAARATMQRLLPLTPGPQLLQILPKVLRLREMSRSDHADWLQHFERSILELLSVQDLLDGVCGKNVHVARSCFYMLHQHGLGDPAQYIGMALATRGDTVLATQALRLCASTAPEVQTALYLKAMSSPFGRIRTSALLSLTQAPGGQDMRTLAQACLLDAQASVRYLAVACLQTMGEDARISYRTILTSPGSSTQAIRVSLLSLGSLRKPEDLELIRTFTQSKMPSVRLAAYTAWFKAAPSDKDAITLQAASDAAPGMQKFAWQMVSHQGAFIPFATLHPLLEARGDHDLLLRYASANKWQWLSTIAHLAMAHAPHRPSHTRLHHELLRWIRDSHRDTAKPDGQQHDLLSQECAQAALFALLTEHDEHSRLLTHELTHHQLTPARPQQH
ncbi:hypothetical protein G3257_25560 [Janthinobacterium lividum]|uniref:hypothetical protein n=1 Tax=Janthinobacterium lividum TaxID=29581 RepID=UPI00159635A4|nr:hypothetical protein [Janthinobacterium lividum]QKY05285.1 hypothetical protein G3257_25560 [Janthinobacterium lividum]